ncbi:MAG: DUF3616 domain-containing protein, partial [Chromatiales bacterium]|nr:DUF3616 domain-containing protein [Chromatiales bacterium]
MPSSFRIAGGFAVAALFAIACSTASAQMRITEYAYSATNGEFIEFTNVGDSAIDMNGWSFDDDSRTAGSFSLSAFGTVQAGESVILTEADAETFRTAWSLCAGIKIIGGLDQNLGRNDEINLFDGSSNLIDRLTYGDQTFSGSIRTQNASGWVSAAGLGDNDPHAWTLSTVNDAEASWASGGNDIGSPGRSTRATIAFDPCTPPAGHPTIQASAATPRLSVPATGIASVSGVLNDPTDPALLAGIDFTIADGETPAGNLAVAATSSNQTVVPNANLSLTGSNANRNLRITPTAAGRSIVTVTVTDGDSNSTAYTIQYAASAASATPSSTRFHTGACDASTAVAIDADHMFMANDEDQMIRLYERGNSGFYRNAFDFTANLEPPDGREVDIEAATRIGNSIYWLGSHSNSAGGAIRPSRYRLFATDVSGSGVNSTLAYAGRYDGLRTDLLAWDAGNGHGLGANALGLTASANNGVIPEESDGSGFNIEALVMAPNGSTAYLGFRAPLQDTSDRDHALIVPVTNFAALIGGAGPANFGTPILLDLDGRAIRALERSADGQYLILAGPTASSGGFALYVWDGNAATPPQRLTTDLSFDVSGGSFEGIVGVPDSLTPGSQIQLVVDNGDSQWYGDGLCKETGTRQHQKFRSEIVTLAYDNGVADSVQDQVPDPAGGGFGDGNGDGTQDAQQA